MGDNIYIYIQDDNHNNNSIDKLKTKCFLKNASVIYTNTQLVFFLINFHDKYLM